MTAVHGWVHMRQKITWTLDLLEIYWTVCKARRKYIYYPYQPLYFKLIFLAIINNVSWKKAQVFIKEMSLQFLDITFFLAKIGCCL